MSAPARVIIVGAGLAGLACATHLVRRGVACTVVEASDEVGGRVRTDRVEGFQLDRGFQVLLTEYPEAASLLDYPALHLHAFHPGALVRYAGRFHRISDPFRRPQDLLSSLMSPVGSWRDKLTMFRLRQDALNHRVCARAGGGERTTLEALQAYGFSPAMQERFLRPFLGGVFLDPSLSTPCRLFEFVWAAFSRASIALPQAGMGAIARSWPRRSRPIRSVCASLSRNSTTSRSCSHQANVFRPMPLCWRPTTPRQPRCVESRYQPHPAVSQRRCILTRLLRLCVGLGCC